MTDPQAPSPAPPAVVGESSKRPLSPSPSPPSPATKKSRTSPPPPLTSTSAAAAAEELVAEPNQSQSHSQSTPTPKRGGKAGAMGKREKVGQNWNKDKRGGPRDEKRVWEPRGKGGGGGGDGEGEGEGDGEGAKRLPKKKCAVLVGYCGTGYSGMQIQPDGAKTIEGDFFEALVKAGAISADNSDDPRKVDVQRAARTDAGVHAAGNCISLKMILEPPLPDGFPTLASYVNSFLPEQIRMWGFVRAMKSFQARTACDSRIYEYLLPSYCLLPPGRDDPLAKQLDETSPGWRDGLGGADFVDAADAPVPPPAVAEPSEESEEKAETKAENGADGKTSGEQPGESKAEVLEEPKARREFERRRGWRIDAATLQRFREIVAQFKGTHNFHNYTVGKPFNDRTVKRYMIKLEVRDPVVYGDIEWISVSIHGQSFMLHQIRKMISLALLACRTGTPASLLPETFGPKKIHIPKAPPLGLLLEAPQFGNYNSKVENKLNGLIDDRDPVDYGLYAEEIQQFKVKYIYERLRQDELETNTFHKWIRQMDCSPPEMLSFLNTKGVIPPEADITKAAAKADETATGDAKADKRGKAVQVLEDSDDEEVDVEAMKRGELEG